MFDVNHKQLFAGDDVYCYGYGLCKVGNNNISIIDSTGESRLVPTDKLTKVRTWKELAKEALEIQDACNIVGLAQAFANVAKEVRYRLDPSTQAVNTHPVIVLWISKLSSLSDPSGLAFTKAYDWAKDNA